MLIGPVTPQSSDPPGTKPASKHTIGVYLVTSIPKVRLDKAPLADLALAAEPLVTHDDIYQYDWESHTIRLKTQAAADRILNPASPGTPSSRFGGAFVLVVDGQRIYSGQKRWIGTSVIYGVPVIHTGPSADQFQPKFAIRIHPPPREVPDPRGDARLKKALQELLLMPKDRGQTAADWGKPSGGLRCRWLPLGGPVSAGTAPIVHIEIENTSGQPVVWECMSKYTWMMRVPGVSPGTSLYMPPFAIKPLQATGARSGNG